MERMRFVLIVCYDFPRISNAGVIRIYQFAKRLPEFGWQPVILTAQPADEKRQDNVEISDGELPCPKITVATSRFAVPMYSDHSAAADAFRSNGSMTALARFAAQFAVPDGKIGWLIPAVKRGVQIAREYPIQACFSVSPRPTAHFVAYRIARRLDIPWIADFVLPWSDAYWLARRPSLVTWLDERIESFVVRSAQRISVAYPELARSLVARHGAVCEDKIAVVPTGFDEELFVGVDPTPPAKFTVVYPGNHFCEEGRDGEYFLKTIDEWIDRAPWLKDKVEFVFIGKRDDVLLQQRAVMAHPEVIRIEPLVSHRACIQAILSSHLCVVNTVGNRIPAKVYECMRAGKPILALTEPGSHLATLLEQYSKAFVFPPGNTSGIRQTLEIVLRQSDLKTFLSTDAARSAAKYCSIHSAEMIARIFDQLFTRRVASIGTLLNELR
jgi:glycosyltransferase involved in cell wall biosynthesis